MNALATQSNTAAGFGLLLSPATLEAAKETAAMLSKSELVPKAFAGKPNDILIAGAMGHRLGLDLFSALSGIAVVNGRPTLWGDAQLAVCQARPDWAGMDVKESGVGDALSITVTITRKGHSSPYVGAFSMEDAKRAGLYGKAGPWSQYPRRMCMLRARAFALRSAFADALSGFHAREEIEDDMIDVTSTASVRVPEPVAGRTREIPQDPPSDPINETPVDTPKDPPPVSDSVAAPTVASIQAIASRIHSEHKSKGLAEIKAVLGKLGVAKLADCQPDQVERAHLLLTASERALAEGV